MDINTSEKKLIASIELGEYLCDAKFLLKTYNYKEDEEFRNKLYAINEYLVDNRENI